MSWNVYLTDIDPATVEEAATKGYGDFKARYSDADEVFPAMDEQFEVALEMAKIALHGGVERKPVVGEGNVNVTLSGHANPDHRPRQGWANDLVTVSVQRRASRGDPMNLAPYRKAAVAVGLGVAEVAAYIAANPKDLPGWVVGAAAAVNAFAIGAVPNRQKAVAGSE